MPRYNSQRRHQHPVDAPPRHAAPLAERTTAGSGASPIASQRYGRVRKGRPWPVFNVRARAPLRLGLAGGGTDLSPYCDEYGGAILNATIDRFAFAHVFSNDTNKIIFRARDVNQEELLDPDAN